MHHLILMLMDPDMNPGHISDTEPGEEESNILNFRETQNFG